MPPAKIKLTLSDPESDPAKVELFYVEPGAPTTVSPMTAVGPNPVTLATSPASCPPTRDGTTSPCSSRVFWVGRFLAITAGQLFSSVLPTTRSVPTRGAIAVER
ncbi:MAG: hypothetical protein KDB80_12870 [Planctomycetes bacterium]|nr:hypothetical protein [Planctomycetota bacterium]